MIVLTLFVMLGSFIILAIHRGWTTEIDATLERWIMGGKSSKKAWPPIITADDAIRLLSELPSDWVAEAEAVAIKEFNSYENGVAKALDKSTPHNSTKALVRHMFDLADAAQIPKVRTETDVFCYETMPGPEHLAKGEVFIKGDRWKDTKRGYQFLWTFDGEEWVRPPAVFSSKPPRGEARDGDVIERSGETYRWNGKAWLLSGTTRRTKEAGFARGGVTMQNEYVTIYENPYRHPVRPPTSIRPFKVYESPDDDPLEPQRRDTQGQTYKHTKMKEVRHEVS